MIKLINTEMSKVANWLAVNELSLNFKKTNFIIFLAKNKCYCTGTERDRTRLRFTGLDQHLGEVMHR